MDAVLTPANLALLLCVCLGVVVLAVVADEVRTGIVRAMWRTIGGEGLDAILAAYLITAGTTVMATGTAPAGTWPRQIGWALLAGAVPALALLSVRLGGRMTRRRMTS